MSDSDLSDAPSAAIPSDTDLEKNLRSELRKAAQAREEYTVRTIREASEKTLDLPAGFYKGHDKWNERSKAIIKAEAEKVSTAENEPEEPEPAPAKATKKVAKKKEPVPKRPTKRPAPAEKPRPRKKAKPASDEEDELESSEALSSAPSDFGSDLEEEQVKKSRKRPAVKDSKKPPTKPKTKPAPAVSATNDLDDAGSVGYADKDRLPPDAEDEDGSDSEMSVVLDDEPANRRSKSKDVSEQKPKKSQPPKSKPSEDTDPDKEEIKKLQGWLVKCGVRKVWGKELKPYETSKAKINHLKEMLSGAGMTGRFSNEKAASIKEARELAADIEAVQEGAQRWGKSDEDDGGEAGPDKARPGRRIVRGAKNYAFLSSDGEETD